MKSLKGLTHEQIMAETDHFFKEDSFGDRAVIAHGGNSGPECFLLNENRYVLKFRIERQSRASKPGSPFIPDQKNVVAHSLIGLSHVALCSCRLFARRAVMFVTLSALPIWLPGPLQATTIPSPEVKACSSETCPDYCAKKNLAPGRVFACVAHCKNSCLPVTPPDPPPVTITPKYMIMSVLYAPPGCTAGSPTQCGTNNGSSFVDYNTTSANGTKVTNKDSFQLGVTISYDNSSLAGGAIDASGSYGFSRTMSDGTAVNVTKSQSNDIKEPGNGDGIDHGQDQIVLLLHPSVTLKKHADQILWNFSKGGVPYEVYVSELSDPSTMRPAVAAVFNELGFTTADFQTILAEDPLAGGQTGAALDPQRFWDTGYTFPYEPTKSAPVSSCNNQVCNCIAVQDSFVNDNVSDVTTEDVGQTTVDLTGSVGVPKVWSLKVDTKMIWTTSATTDNSTESKQTATATITCPSTQYKGLTGMDVWWDSRYGSFVFIPFDPGLVPLISQGHVLDASGQGVARQLVKLIYAGKTYHTYTAQDGGYRFPSSAGKLAPSGTAQIETGSLSQQVNAGAADPVVLRMK